MESWTDRFIDGMFSGRINPKDEYAVADCKDPRVKRVLKVIFIKMRQSEVSFLKIPKFRMECYPL